MLFFFELALFLLIMLTLALAEFVGLTAAVGVWTTCTVASLVGYGLTRAGRRRTLTPDAGPAEHSRSLDARWERALLYHWKRTNVLLLAGVVVLLAWTYLGQRPG